MLYRLLLPLFLLASTCSIAQEKTVSVKIINSKGEGVAHASVSVVSARDSLQKWMLTADSNGVAAFQLRQDSFYSVEASSVGFVTAIRNVLITSGTNAISLILTPANNGLATVVVTARKPLMRQEDDKTIVDPEALAAISTNAYETIEKTPGLFIDPDGRIYISSSTPATVYINGREQKMSAADVATMLKSLPPSAIASIEILRTPSAKYDASGSGGIVNVVLKKGVRIGLTGSVNAGMQQGRYGNQFIGLNLNNNTGALTTYLNLNYGRRSTYDRIATDRLFAADSILSQDAYTRYKSSNVYVGFGLSYDINKKWAISYDGRFSYNHNDNNSINQSQFIKQSAGTSSGFRSTNITNNGNSHYFSQSAELKYKLDSMGSEWSTEISYTLSPNRNNQDFIFGDGRQNNSPHFFSAESDFTKKLRDKTTIEGGIKTTQTRFRNNTDYFSFTSGIRIPDQFRSGAYTYNEGINAAFAQASKTISNIVFKAGARLENTNMQGHQTRPADTAFSLHRTDLFPYVYISKTVKRIAGYDLRAYLVYRRTISRPAYEYLNPSTRIIDPYLLETGNPSLRPQFTQNYEANISVDERPIVALGLNKTNDIFTQVVYPTDTSSKVSYRTYDNLGSNKETYIRLMGAIPPGKKYFFVVVAQYNHNFYNGLYESKSLSYKRGSWTLFSYQTLKLTPLTVLSISGFVRFNGQQQFYQLSTFGEARLGLNQQFFKKKLTLTLSANDIFRTNKNAFSIDQGSIHATGLRQGDTRRFGMSLRYNFGIRKKEENNMFSVDPEAK